jgi:glycosyltransferase involved in cell wall biosynthesis
MKILVISYDYQPKNSPQGIQISRLIDGLCKEHEIVLLTEANKGRLINEQYQDNLTILPIPPVKSNIWSNNIDKLFYYSIPFYKTLPDEYNHIIKLGYDIVTNYLNKGYFPDLMISFGQPMSDHMLALKLVYRYSIPWISHFSDPWYGNPYSKKFFLSNFLFIRRWESKVFANSHAVIFTNDYTRNFVTRRYPEKYTTKTFVVPHSFDPKLYPKSSYCNDKITIRYIGSLYGNRSPLYLFKAIEQLKKVNHSVLNNLQIEFYGYVSRLYLKHFKNPNVSVNVKYMGSIGYDESIKLMTSANILLSIDAPSKTNLFLPSKLVEYLGAGKIILGLTNDGPAKDLILQMGGISAQSDDIGQISKALINVVENYPFFDVNTALNLSKEYEVEKIQGQFNKIVQIFY